MEKTYGIGLVVSLVIGITALFTGGTTIVEESRPLGGQTSDSWDVGGDLIVRGGCVDIYATSTETVGSFSASTTATIEGVDGVVMFEFGSCR